MSPNGGEQSVTTEVDGKAHGHFKDTNNEMVPSRDKLANAVHVIKDAILQSQQRALGAVNQEQLALYYGIGRYISANTREKVLLRVSANN